jgi:hypothetical protein
VEKIGARQSVAHRTAGLIHYDFATHLDRLAPFGEALLHHLVQRRD